jgi:sRNA-binding carbon storage regulator CsrA
MLVLSRRENETIEFPALGVVIRLFGFTGRRVRVGIEAPIRLKVTRGETSGNAESMLRSAGSVDSIAEHVIAEELGRLESELAALAELATGHELNLARRVAADAGERLVRIRRTVSAALRQHEAVVSNDLARTRCDDVPRPLREGPTSCVRQSPADYAVCPA